MVIAGKPRRVLIMGAAGRDFHNFNVAFRDDPALRGRRLHRRPDPGHLRPTLSRRACGRSATRTELRSSMRRSSPASAATGTSTRWCSPTATSSTPSSCTRPRSRLPPERTSRCSVPIGPCSSLVCPSSPSAPSAPASGKSQTARWLSGLAQAEGAEGRRPAPSHALRRPRASGGAALRKPRGSRCGRMHHRGAGGV